MFSDGAFYLIDTQSTHGLQLNGSPIRGIARLAHGDKFRIGSTTFEFLLG